MSAQVTITHQRNPFFLPTTMANKLRRNNAFSAVFQIIGSVAVFYLPYYTVCLYESLCAAVGATPRTDPAVKSLSFALITGSALCNGLLYGIKNKLLKKTYQNYRRKMMTKCEVNQEIQARTPSACGSRRPSLTPVFVNHKPAAGAGTAGTAGTAALLRRSSNVSLIEPGEARRGGRRRGTVLRAAAAATGSTNGLNFDNYYAEDVADFAGVDDDALRRCYSSIAEGTAGGFTPHPAAAHPAATANRNTFVRRMLRDSRGSPRILITRAMSEENESYASEPDTPVRKDLVHKLSSSSVTLFIDEQRNHRRARRSDEDDVEDDDEDDEEMSPAYSSLSSSNEDSCCNNCELHESAPVST